MKRSIASLLKKKSWSGKDVGRILLASAANDIKNQGKQSYKPLITQEEYAAIENSLTTERDFRIYGCYKDIYNSLIDTYDKIRADYQQFYHGYYRHLNSFMQCHNSDRAMIKATDYPLIMTQSQHNRLKAKSIEKLRDCTESFHEIVLYTVGYFISNPSKAPESIRATIEATKEQQVTNQRILSTYNEENKLGYYQLPDGRRSDEMNADEWRESVRKLYISTHTLTKKGNPATETEIREYYKDLHTAKAYKLFYEGIEGIKAIGESITGANGMDWIDAAEETRLMRALEDMLGDKWEREQARIEKAEAPTNPLILLINTLIDHTQAYSIIWHTYDNPPEDLTKYDILLTCLSRYSNNRADDVGDKQQHKEFKADYPDLYRAVVAYIENSIPSLKGLKPSQVFKAIISYGELAELNFLDYTRYVEPSEYDIITAYREEKAKSAELYTDTFRAIKNGIAIAHEPKPYQLEENGDYKEFIDPLSIFRSLDSIAQSKTELDTIKAYRETLMKPALRHLYAFNALAGIIARVYEVDEVETEVQQKASALEQQIDSYNAVLYEFYGNVYGDWKEAARKRALIKAIFEPIDIDACKPTDEAIADVTATIKGLGFSSTARKELKNFEPFINRLMRMGA